MSRNNSTLIPKDEYFKNRIKNEESLQKCYVFQMISVMINEDYDYQSNEENRKNLNQIIYNYNTNSEYREGVHNEINFIMGLDGNEFRQIFDILMKKWFVSNRPYPDAPIEKTIKGIDYWVSYDNEHNKRKKVMIFDHYKKLDDNHMLIPKDLLYIISFKFDWVEVLQTNMIGYELYVVKEDKSNNGQVELNFRKGSKAPNPSKDIENRLQTDDEKMEYLTNPLYRIDNHVHYIQEGILDPRELFEAYIKKKLKEEKFTPIEKTIDGIDHWVIPMNSELYKEIENE